MSERIVLYVSEHCRFCEGAVAEARRLSREFNVPYDVVSTDVTPVDWLPAVPAATFRGITYVGVNFPRRLRLALTDPARLDVSAYA